MDNADLPHEVVEAQLRHERTKRIKLSVLTSVLIRPLAIITPFVTLPLFLNYLGQERFGLYESVGALAAWFSLTSAGFGMGLINRLADCQVSGDRELARRYVSSLGIGMLVLGAVLIAVLTAVTPLVNWQLLFRSHDPIAIAETPWAVWVSGMISLMTLGVNISFVIYFSHQELHRFNIWDGVNRVLTLLACIAVVYTRWGVVGVVIASAGGTLLIRLVNCFAIFYFEKPWLRPTPRLFEWKLFNEVMREGIGFFVLQMAVVVLYQTDKLIISASLGVIEVTAYAVLGRLFLSGYGLFMLVLGPLWPAHGDALRRGDLAWVRRMLRNSLWMGCGTMMTAGVVLFFFGEPIVRIWTRGQNIEISRSLVLAMALVFVLRAWVDCRSVILNSAGIVAPQLYFFGGHAVANFALAVLLARWYGVEGVAWATVITSLLTSAWGYPWLMRKYVWNRADQFALATAGTASSS